MRSAKIEPVLIGCFAPLIQSSCQTFFFLFIGITLIVFKKTVRSVQYNSFLFFSFQFLLFFELLWIIVCSDVTLELTPKATADTNVFILKTLL
jgi:hypothetical protein